MLINPRATLAALLLCAVTPALAAEPDGLILPPGFHAQVVADGLANLRHLAVRDNSTLYASTRGGRGGANPGIIALHLDASHKADKIEHFSEVSGGTGIRIQGNTLYAATVTDIYRIGLKPGELVPSAAPEIIVSGMPAASFNNRMVALDGKGNLFVSVGGTGNICTVPAGRGAKPAGLLPCPGVTDRGGVWKFSAAKPNQKFPGDGAQVATGLRDTDAMDFRAGDALYLYMHDRSGTHDTWPELVSEQDEENLAEEMHRITGKGVVNMGWPYTYWDGARKTRLMAPEYGGDGKVSPPPGLYADPVVTFSTSHSAPLDLVFYNGRQFPAAYRGGAFVVRHGGNGAERPDGRSGYDVMFIPFQGGKPGTPVTFADGFAGPTPDSKIVAKAAYRPVGAAVGPDGSLYVAESNKGRIWRIYYDGKP